MLRRIANYISILVVVPILIGVASTITATLRSDAVMTQLGSIAFVYRYLLRLTPLVSAWIAFGFLYLFLPNTRVKILPALVGGLVGALLWLGWQKFYIGFQLGVARYNKIYGTFASVPIFLAWLYVSWVIILLGVEVAFAVQNHATYHLEQRAEKANLKARAVLGLAIILRAAEGLSLDVPPFEIAAFAGKNKVPVRLLNELVSLFVRESWLAEVAEHPGSYVLLKSPERIKSKDVLDIILNDGAAPESLGLAHLSPTLEATISRLDKGLQQSLGEQSLQDILNAPA